MKGNNELNRADKMNQITQKLMVDVAHLVLNLAQRDRKGAKFQTFDC